MAQAPFANVKIFLHVRATNDAAHRAKHDAKKAIKKLGGSLTLSLDHANLVVFENGSDALLQNATAMGKVVVTVDYLRECKVSNARLTVRPEHLVKVGGSPSAVLLADFVPASAVDGVGHKGVKPYLFDVEEEELPSNSIIKSSPRHGGVAEISTQALDENVTALLGTAPSIPKPRTRPCAAAAPGKRERSETSVEMKDDSDALNTLAPQPTSTAALKPIAIKPERISITGPEDEKGMLADIIEALGAEFVLKVFGRVKKPTHYVVLSDAITPKILLARITGAPMLTREWITDSLQYGSFVEPLPQHFHPLYVAPSCMPCASGAPVEAKSRRSVVVDKLERHRKELSGVCKVPQAVLLEGMSFFLLGRSENPTNDVYAELLRLMGAHVARSLRDESLTAVIEVDGGVMRNSGLLSAAEKNVLQSTRLVSTAWIVETASTCRVVPLQSHAVALHSAADELSPLIVGVPMLTPLAKTKRGPCSAVKYADQQVNTQQL